MSIDLLIAGAVFLPLLGFVLAGVVVLFKLPDFIAQWGATILLILAAVCSWMLLVSYSGNASVFTIAQWISSDTINAQWALRIDRLSITMLLVVTTVSALVHLYAIGYMSHDPHRPRFFSYLSLFTFAMLMLVTANDFLQLFFGWEGVGLASYLLIGFWFSKPSACAASIKAFIMNRIGDFGFLLGIFTIAAVTGSVQFDEVFAAVPKLIEFQFSFLGIQASAIEIACFLLLVGAMGKSAQFLLHTWLPDAMEGPTPVSALLHAATMVTAGVFLLARISPMMEFAPMAKSATLIVGLTSATFMGILGLVQNDIKRIVAYSTGSQLGYMFAAMGVGAYQIGIFHLVTHAGFKALLFLGAGSVVHAMANEQDIRKMGNLWSKLPFTTIAMIIGTVGLIGAPLTGGYYSKDAIIEATWAQEGTSVSAYWLLVIGALMTSIYSWRLIARVFFGKSNVDTQVLKHVHEAPPTMMVPMAILITSVFALGFPMFSSFVGGAHEAFWGSAIFNHPDNKIMTLFEEVPFWVKLMPTIAMILGGIIALYLFIIAPQIPEKFVKTNKDLYNLLVNRFYFDYLYDVIAVRGIKKLSRILWIVGDQGIIDRFGPNGISKISMRLAKQLQSAQNGLIYHYALVMLAGLVTLIAIIISTHGG